MIRKMGDFKKGLLSEWGFPEIKEFKQRGKESVKIEC